ncbi:MAG: lipocalin family protein [Bacteroidales bacterium]|nr:lipocalin family protein [Bacteroidales bacterium]
MKKIAIFLAAILLVPACGEKTAQPGNDDLEGVWECIRGCEAEMLEFNIAEEGQVFFMYSGQRIYHSGTWKLDKNRLTLAYDDEETLTYPLTLKNDTLVLGNNEMMFAAYTPAKDPCDLSSLFALIDDISFSQPMLEDFPWNVSSDSGTEEVIVDGQMVQTIVKLEGDFSAIWKTAGTVATELRNLGFDTDPLMASDLVSGYRKGSCVVIFWPEIDDEDNTEAEVPLSIYFGKLP